METTPVWVPIVIAGLGLLGTALAPVLTQLLAQRAESQRRVADRDDRLSLWSRDDQHRWIDERKEAYVSAVLALEELRREFAAVALGNSKKDDHEIAGREARDAVTRIRIWGGEKVASTAESLYKIYIPSESRPMTSLLAAALDYPRDKEAFDAAHEAYKAHQRELIQTIRDDLGVPSRLTPIDAKK